MAEIDIVKEKGKWPVRATVKTDAGESVFRIVTLHGKPYIEDVESGSGEGLSELVKRLQVDFSNVEIGDRLTDDFSDNLDEDGNPYKNPKNPDVIKKEKQLSDQFLSSDIAQQRVSREKASAKAFANEMAGEASQMGYGLKKAAPEIKESVIDATSRFGKKAGKELLGAIPVLGGLASAALSGDASAGIPGLEEADPVGMTGQQENEMLLKDSEQKAKKRYEQSPAGQAAQQRNVMRGPASVSAPDGGGALKETNEDQALRLLGLGGTASSRAKQAADSYMNRTKISEQAPEELQQPASREIAAQSQQVNFVTPQSTPQTPISNQVSQGPAPAFDFNADLPADIKGGLNEQRKAYQDESAVYKQAGTEMAKAEAQYNQESQQELEAQQKAKDLEIQVSKDVDERSRQRLEPKNFFAGKNTWQKVMGGLGLFLSSFSKEGAARFAEAVDRDIELDLKAQESAITSKDKAIADKQSLVKQYYDQHKDMRAARLLARADAFSMIKGRAELAAASTKSQAAAGAARQAAGMAEQQAQTAKVAALIQLQKAQQSALTKNSGKMVSVLGFEGMAPTEAEAKEFRALGGETKQAIDSIAQLRQLAAKGSSVSPEDRAKAETLSRLLSASLRTTVIGPGAVSDAERAILEKIAANPLDVFSLKASQLTRLGVLENQVKQNLRNKAQIFGLQEAAVGRKGPM